MVQSGLRPDNKEAAFEAARNEIGPQLSRKAFGFAWKLMAGPPKVVRNRCRRITVEAARNVPAIAGTFLLYP
jgi:hypothetical protein